MLVPPGLIYWL